MAKVSRICFSNSSSIPGFEWYFLPQKCFSVGWDCLTVVPEWSHKIPCGDSSPLGSITKKNRWCKNCNIVALFRRYSHLTYVIKFPQYTCYSMDCGKQHRSARLLLSGVWLLCDLVSGDEYNTWAVEAHNVISRAWNSKKLRWHTWIHGELDECVCFRIKFHLLLFSHSRITGISDGCSVWITL